MSDRCLDRYRRMRLEGRCLGRSEGCEKKARKGKALCLSCAVAQSTKKKAERVIKRAVGECYDCRRPVVPGSSKCEYHSHRRKARRLKLPGSEPPMLASELSQKARDAWL